MGRRPPFCRVPKSRVFTVHRLEPRRAVDVADKERTRLPPGLVFGARHHGGGRPGTERRVWHRLRFSARRGTVAVMKGLAGAVVRDFSESAGVAAAPNRPSETAWCCIRFGGLSGEVGFERQTWVVTVPSAKYSRRREAFLALAVERLAVWRPRARAFGEAAAHHVVVALERGAFAGCSRGRRRRSRRGCFAGCSAGSFFSSW